MKSALVISLWIFMSAQVGLADNSCQLVQWGANREEVQLAYRPHSEVNAAVLGLKTRGELERYLSCYHPDSDPTSKLLFEKHYRAMIQKAASSYGIPFSVLACLLYRESTYWSGVASGVNAQGIAQIMPDTVPMLNRIIAAPGPDSSESELRSKIQEVAHKRPSDQKDRDLAYLKERLKVVVQFGIVRRGWLGYWDHRSPPHVVNIDELRMNRTMSEDQKIRAAELGISAGAALLKYCSLLLQTPESSPDHWLITVGAYNLGSGGINHYRHPAGAPAAAVIASLKEAGIEETAGHMESIRDCSKHDCWKPMSGTAPRNCHDR